MAVPFARKVKVKSRHIEYDDDTGLSVEGDAGYHEVMAAVQPLSTSEATSFVAMDAGLSTASLYKLYSMELLSKDDVVLFNLGALGVSAQIIAVMPYFSSGNSCEHYKYIAKGK